MKEYLTEQLELTEELKEASRLYYNGEESFLTDFDFDIKLERLKELEKRTNTVYSNSPTVSVGYKVLNELKRITIDDKPMLSLDKVHSADEVLDFIDNTPNLVASIKCDGLSVRIIYENGELVSANTRGDGYEGGDITEHIKYFLNVPQKINKTDRYIIDGEAIIFDSDFAIVNKNKNFKNNRNTASGALALLDMSIVQARRLSFIAWDVILNNGNSYFKKLFEASELGFTIVPFSFLKGVPSKEKIDSVNEKLLMEAKKQGIPCDGIVWRINDTETGNKRGKTNQFFLNAVAWKQKNEEYETELLNITYEVSRNGVLTPVAKFKPITIDGSVVEKCSLFNLSVLESKLNRPYEGQKIYICKRNQIIPYITRAEKDTIKDKTKFIDIPSICPKCGNPLSITSSALGVKVLKCINKDCNGTLSNKIDHYLSNKGLNIKGISKATIKKLIEWEWITNLSDIYELKKHKEEWIKKPGFGEVSVNKIITTIEASRSGVSLSSFIAALGIPLIGNVAAKQIASFYSTWRDFRAAVGTDWTSFDGFGVEMSNALNNYNYDEADKISSLLSFDCLKEQPSSEQKTNLKGLSFVITGKLSKKRDDIKADIENLGGKVTGSISSKTSYLICNDKETPTTKLLKAKELGVPIITEEEFKKLYDC